MRSIRVWVGVAAGLVLAATAQGQDRQAEREAAMAAALPGPVHKELAKLAGEYTTVAKFTPQPGAPAMESKGTAKITVILEGRFLSEENTGSMVGVPLRGLRLTGYNSGTRQYEGCWLYTMATGIMSLTGTSKDEGRTIDWVATYTDPQGQKQTLHILNRHLDDDHFVVVLKTPNEKGPVLETTYSRKK
jgi:hypothetical protein